MRQIVLDTETTGLESAKGHRVIEIGCIELRERRRTGERFHCYLDPGREIDRGALEVHGIDDAFLRGKPRFADEIGRASGRARVNHPEARGAAREPGGGMGGAAEAA